jgi:ATP-dependent Clp protease, protease subunit
MTNVVQQLRTPKKIYGFFVGIIDQHAVQRVANGLTNAVNNTVEEVHMLFQSTGGMVGDGICLHNIFETAPVRIHLYNAGSIASIGVIAYLGAKMRISTESATFMIHKTYFSPVQATAETLQSAADAAILDDRRVEAILHKKITLSDERWTAHKFADQWLSAEEALEAKLVTEIGEFSPPMGIQLLYLGAT